MESESDPASTRAERLSGVALRNVAAATATRVSTVAVGIVLTPIVLAGLGREMYGVAQVVNSLYDFISLLRGGLSAALRRYVTLAHHSNRSEEASLYFAVGFWWSGLLRTGILLLGWAVAWPLGRFLRLPESMHAEATFGIVLIIAATVLADAGAMFEIPIFATGRTAILSLIRAGATWVRLALTIVAFRVFHPTLPVFGAVLIVVELVPLLLIIPIAQRMGVVRSVFPRWTSGSDQARRVLFSYGRLAVLGQAAALLYTSSDSLFIGRIYGAAAVTAYTLGARWSSLIRGFLLASITSLTPLFTQLEAVGESHRTRRALTEVVKLSAAVAVPFCLTPCVVGDILLTKWVGAEYRGSYAYMLAMLAPMTIEVALMPVWMALRARGRIGWLAVGDMVVAIGNVLISLVLALGFKLGLLGFALGNTFAMLAKQLVLRPRAARRDPEFPPARDYIGALPRALLGGAPALFALYLARPYCERGVPELIVGAGAAGLLCLAGSLYATLGTSGIRTLRRRFG